jgi:protein dithiol oxidoreductase (disulfide-forming)
METAMKRLIAVLASFLFAGIVLAQSAPKPGAEYRLINPAQSVSGTKIEVLEFFNYACPHCYEFEPTIKGWKNRKPADVDFSYVPAVFNERMMPLAKLYYALEETGLLPTLHDKVYDAIHRQGKNLTDRESIVKWVSEQPGVDAKKFEAAFDSFSVGNKVQRAAQLTRNYRVPGTPYVAVSGTYLTGPSMTLNASGAFDPRRFQQVLDSLIDMARRKA